MLRRISSTVIFFRFQYIASIVAILLVSVGFNYAFIRGDMGSPSAVYIYNYSFVLNGFFIPIVFLLAGFPVTTLFAKDYNSGMIKIKQIRCSIDDYLYEVATLSCCSAFILVFIGMMLYGGFLTLVFYLNGGSVSDPVLAKTEELADMAFAFFLYRSCLLASAGMMWNSIAMIISAYTQNIYLTLTIPYAIYFIMERIGLLLPEYFNFYGLTLGGEIGSLVYPLNFIYFVMVSCLVSGVSSYLFVRKGRQLFENGKI